MMGMFLAGWTVHYWNATYVLMMFLMGAGAWFADATPASATPAPQPDRREAPAFSRGRTGPVYSRSGRQEES